MKNNLELAAQRTRSYWYVDGLWEILSGIILALLGMIYAAQSTSWLPFPASDLKNATLVLGLPLGLAAIAWLKQNITYRRTGYVAYKQENIANRLQKNWKTLVLVFGALFLAIILVLVFPWARAAVLYGITCLPVLIGLGFSLSLLNQARQTKLSRFRFFGWLGIGLSLILAALAFNQNRASLLPAELFASSITASMPVEIANAMRLNADFAYWLTAILCSSLGLMLLGSGIFTLIRYLRDNPASEAYDEQ